MRREDKVREIKASINRLLLQAQARVNEIVDALEAGQTPFGAAIEFSWIADKITDLLAGLEWEDWREYIKKGERR